MQFIDSVNASGIFSPIKPTWNLWNKLIFIIVTFKYTARLDFPIYILEFLSHFLRKIVPVGSLVGGDKFARRLGFFQPPRGRPPGSPRTGWGHSPEPGPWRVSSPCTAPSPAGSSCRASWTRAPHARRGHQGWPPTRHTVCARGSQCDAWPFGWASVLCWELAFH